MTIVEFIRARLDEDEHLARAASSDREREWIGSFESGHPWRYAEFGNGVYEYNDGIASGSPLVAQTGDEAAQDHIARHDPARVLAQVAAMRAIVELHEAGDDGRCTTCIEYCGDNIYPTEYAKAPCLESRHLAAIWSDHDQYDPAWPPDA